MPHFTAENAATMAKLSHEPNSARNKLKTALEDYPADVAMELQIVEEQIAHARKALNDRTPYCMACERMELQPHHRAQLMKSLDTFLDRRRILLGRPMPGTLRPIAPGKPKRDRPSYPEPIPQFQVAPAPQADPEMPSI